MDSKITNEHTDAQDLIGDDDPTGELPQVDSQPTAAPPAGPTGDSVVDPNVLALRRVDAEVRRLMESWVELENQLQGRDSEILRLRAWAGGMEGDLQATRQELGAARSDCERLRGEVVDHRAEMDRQRQQAELRTAEAESLRAELAGAQSRLAELTTEVRLGKENIEQLTSRLAEHRDALSGMATRVRQAEKSSQALDGAKAEMAARVADAEQRCADLNRRFQDAEAAKRQAEKDVPVAARRAKELQGELDKTREGAAKLEQKLQEKTALIRAMETAVRDQEKTRNDQKEQVRKAEQALAAAQKTISQMDASLQSQRQKTELAENNGVRSAELLQAAQSRISALELIEKQAASVQSELAAAEVASRAAGAERTRLLEEIASRDALAIDLRQRIGALEAERAELLARVDELRSQADAVDSEFQTKRKAIAVIGNEMDRLGTIQANIRKLDSMMSVKLSTKSPAPPAPATEEKPRNDRLLVWLDDTHVMKYPLYKADMVIGRAKGSDIRVTGTRTSRRHAHIFVEDGAVIIEDLGSLNGITVNSEAVRRKQLHDGDVVDVGGARLRYVDLDEKAAARRGEMMASN